MKTREEIESLISANRFKVKHLRLLKENCRKKEDLDRYKKHIDRITALIKALEWVINE
jgi:hypothetical protein